MDILQNLKRRKKRLQRRWWNR